MAQYDGPKGGVLFPIQADKVRQNGPVMDGKLAIEGDVATYIFEKLQAGQVPEVRLAAWSRMGKSNNKFLSIKADIPWEDNPANTKAGGGQRRGAPSPHSQQGNLPVDDIPF
jgi:hypothetical protein